jgi:hypothetical protein
VIVGKTRVRNLPSELRAGLDAAPEEVSRSRSMPVVAAS